MLQSFINLFNKHLLMMCGVSDMKVMILWSTKSEYITSTVLKSLSSPYRESWVQVGSEGRQIHSLFHNGELKSDRVHSCCPTVPKSQEQPRIMISLIQLPHRMSRKSTLLLLCGRSNLHIYVYIQLQYIIYIYILFI